VLGVGDAILALVITSPAVVLRLRAIAAGPAPDDRAEAKGGIIIMGATAALLLLARIAMSRL
jgi:hypothetical protein